MAKIVRKTQKIFGSNAGGSGITEFGSTASGSTVFTTDLDIIQSTEYLQGWLGAILAGVKRLPIYEDMNALQFLQTTQLAYLLQEGMAEYDLGTTYYQNSIVKQVGTFKFYGSLTNNNIGNVLTDPVNWKLLIDFDVVPTETNPSIIEIATQIETNTGADDSKAITPLKLQNKISSETTKGIIEIATQAETNTGSDNLRAITPAKLQNKISSEIAKGIIEIATQTETNTGTDDIRAITPLKLANYSNSSKVIFCDINIINNQIVPSTWTDINIPILASLPATTMLCIFRVHAISNVVEIALRTKGDAFNICRQSNDNDYGGGISAMTIENGYIGYIICKTDLNGVVQIKKGAAGSSYSLDLISYIK